MHKYLHENGTQHSKDKRKALRVRKKKSWSQTLQCSPRITESHRSPAIEHQAGWFILYNAVHKSMDHFTLTQKKVLPSNNFRKYWQYEEYLYEQDCKVRGSMELYSQSRIKKLENKHYFFGSVICIATFKWFQVEARQDLNKTSKILCLKMSGKVRRGREVYGCISPSLGK